MTLMLVGTLAMALAVAAIHLVLDRGRLRPDEFEDIAQLRRAQAERAALRRATTRSSP